MERQDGKKIIFNNFYLYFLMKKSVFLFLLGLIFIFLFFNCKPKLNQRLSIFSYIISYIIILQETDNNFHLAINRHL